MLDKIAGGKFRPRVFRSGREHLDDFVRVDKAALAHAKDFLVVFGQRFDVPFLFGEAGGKVMSIPLPAGLAMRTTISRNSPVARLGMRMRTITCSKPRPSVAGD